MKDTGLGQITEISSHYQELYGYMGEIFKYIHVNYLDGYDYNRLSKVMKPYYEWLRSAIMDLWVKKKIFLRSSENLMIN